ncbi:MAG: SDR family NAD(P)-dependent oxidoreductase [Spirochaetia bacterium]|jgi:NAD(P)-dependent dehydrogenase (short-subunit alcohol dehydrogenase family)
MEGERAGLTCVVTGATSGIGREVAAQLAGRGEKVLGVGRVQDRCRTAERQIRVSTGNPDVTFLRADLSSMSEIRGLAREILSMRRVIDVLVNNAGVFTLTRRETADGLEMQLAVNWLAAFMLTGLLMPALFKAPFARVVNISSGSHFSGTMHWDDLGLRRAYHGLKAYSQSKLATVLFSYELTRRLSTAQDSSAHSSSSPFCSGSLCAGRSPAVYAVDPGLVKTQIASKGNNCMVSLVWKIRTMRGITPQDAANSVTWCAADPAAQGRTGLYWKERRSLDSSPESHDPLAARKLWELGESLCGVRFP